MPRNKVSANAHKKAEDQLLALKHISRFIAKGLPAHDVLDGIVHQVVQYLGCDSCFLYVKDGDELVMCAAHDRPVASIENIRLRLDEGLTGWVARERRLLALPREAFKDSRFKTFTNLPEDTYEAFLSAPVICRNQVMGVVNVQYRSAHDHTGDDMEFLTTVGELLGCFLTLYLSDSMPDTGPVAIARLQGAPIIVEAAAPAMASASTLGGVADKEATV